MILKNKLDVAFGPFGSSTGFFLIIGGIIATFFSLIGVLIVIIGAFASFTTTGTSIDIANRRIKFTNNLFGIIPVGKWIDIKPDMKLGLRKSHMGYRAYIRGTQPIGIHKNDIRIYLLGPDNKKIMDVRKFSSFEESKIEIEKLGNELGLNII